MERQQQHPPKSVLVIGAGPAGLTAGYELTTRGVPVVILEKDSDVGGLARTVEYKGFRFDIGGHRFFTKVGPVASVWRQMLGEGFPAASPPLAHLLSRTLLRLPAEAAERAAQPRHLDQPSRVAVVPLDQDVSDTARAQLCRLGVESLRPHAVSHFFRDLHRKSVGDSLQPHRRAMGGAEDQRALAQDRRHQHARARPAERRWRRSSR